MEITHVLSIRQPCCTCILEVIVDTSELCTLGRYKVASIISLERLQKMCPQCRDLFLVYIHQKKDHMVIQHYYHGEPFFFLCLIIIDRGLAPRVADCFKPHNKTPY